VLQALDTSSIEVGLPFSAEPHGLGISVSAITRDALVPGGDQVVLQDLAKGLLAAVFNHAAWTGLPLVSARSNAAADADAPADAGAHVHVRQRRWGRHVHRRRRGIVLRQGRVVGRRRNPWRHYVAQVGAATDADPPTGAGAHVGAAGPAWLPAVRSG
jgi:hypothetical protein